jgi:putative tricarboxylic transport membrane protein
MDRRVDFALSIVVVALGVFIGVASLVAKQPTVVFDPIGPYGFARVIAVAFIIFGTILIIRQIRAARSGLPPEAVARGSEDEEGHPASARRAFAIIIATFGYPILMGPLGYVITTIGYIVGGVLILNERSWKWIVPLAVIYALATFFIFATLLRVPLPLGPLGELFVALGLVDRVR